MSRTPANYTLQVVRGATWEDEFVYTEDDQVTPIDLTGYEARMQVRTFYGAYGLSTTETLVMELLTTGPEPKLLWDTAPDGRLLIRVAAAETIALNPDNARRVKLAYSLELYRPEGVAPEYVIPLVKGSVSVAGEVTR